MLYHILWVLADGGHVHANCYLNLISEHMSVSLGRCNLAKSAIVACGGSLMSVLVGIMYIVYR